MKQLDKILLPDNRFHIGYMDYSKSKVLFEFHPGHGKTGIAYELSSSEESLKTIIQDLTQKILEDESK